VYFHRLRAPRIGPMIACLVLAIAATWGFAHAHLAWGASLRFPPAQGPTRQTKCAKAKNHGVNRAPPRLVKRAAGKRPCGAKQSKGPGSTADPVQPVPQTPTTTGGDSGSAPSDPDPLGGSTETLNPPGGSAPPSGTPQPTSPAGSGSGTPFRFFSPSSSWNTPLASDAPLDPNSAGFVGTFDAEVTRELQGGSGPWINTTDYSVPIYTVPANQPTVRVQLSGQFAPALQSAWDSVPLPSTAVPAAGTDAVLVLWQPSADRIWEFWRLKHGAGGWRASWGAAMQNVSSNQGVYDSQAWPGAKPWWGSSASSLSIAGGLITLEDLQRGQIDHALALAIPKVRAGVFASPAQRSDGTSSSPLSLPEGARLRLDPNLDLTTLHLPRMTLMIAEAAQRYGIFVRDKAKVVHFFAQDPVSTGSNPYAGLGGYFAGKYPSQLLASFPWSSLQLLRMDLHHTS
jgi:hypothetical protein